MSKYIKEIIVLIILIALVALKLTLPSPTQAQAFLNLGIAIVMGVLIFWSIKEEEYFFSVLYIIFLITNIATAIIFFMKY